MVRITICCLLICTQALAQQPRYTFKKFAATGDTAEFKVINPGKNGLIRSYVLARPMVWDRDDDSTTYIRSSITALLCFEGQMKNSKKNGIFTVSLIDSLDHSKRYKIWEQPYVNDKLNGVWKTYTLHGTLVRTETYKDDSVNGISRIYWIDGKTIFDEKEYFNGHNKYIQRDYYPNGKLKSEASLENDSLNGPSRRYYETGTLQEAVEFKNDKFNGTRKYFYPNGQVWIEETYRAGKSWDVIANYTDNGVKRDAGTLHNGNGTLILYNEDGSIRETQTYIDGVAVKQ